MKRRGELNRQIIAKLYDLGDDTKTGICRPILDDPEVPVVLRLVVEAALGADREHVTQYVVRSLDKFYTSSTPPPEANDIDAQYLLEVLPAEERSAEMNKLVKLLREHL